jgi:dsDNA-binding SOS-regulon protein
MTGVYATLNQGVEKLKAENRSGGLRPVLKQRASALRAKIPALRESGFQLDDDIDLRSEVSRANYYEAGTIAYKLYETGRVPTDTEISADVEALLAAYETVLEQTVGPEESEAATREEATTTEGDSTAVEEPTFDRTSALQQLIHGIEASGFVFEPWQLAAYVTALRTKPFVILAGVTGTGKSRLPSLVAQLTGGQCELMPVRPDWTDSADVLGYVDLQGVFRPGRLLEVARNANSQLDQQWTFIVDEMNLARVEQYFAEVLSRIEDRHACATGGFASRPLLGVRLRSEDHTWSEVGLPPNLAIVGTVNMDETTHGFSRKVLDRAFTIELSDTDLSRWNTATVKPATSKWPATAWQPRAITLAGLTGLSKEDTDNVQRVIDTLTNLNGFLQQAQLQVGYRTRDEVALFVLHASEVLGGFLTREGSTVDPLDLAIHMKVLPRLVGGSGAVRRAVLQLLGWARSGKPFASETNAQTVLDEWIDLGRPGALSDSKFPRTTGRLCIMWERFLSEGYTSYWL